MADNEYGFSPLGLDPLVLPEQKEGSYAPLFGAAERKAFDLDTAVSRKQRNVENAFISKIGYDQDSVVGQAGNLGARLASGGSRALGYVATLPVDAVTNMAQASVPNTHIDAWSRIKSGKQLPGDEALLSQTAPGDDGVPQTYAERMQGIDGLRQVSKSIAETMDISSIVDTTRGDRLSDNLREETAPGIAQLREAGTDYDNGDYLDAAGNAIGGAFRTLGSALSTGIQDPGAISEYVVENIPQLAAMAFNPLLGSAINVGYGANEYRDGITDFQAENSGAQPSAEDRLKMGLFAASASLAEQVGDVSLLKSMRGQGKAITAVPAAAGREGVTEGYQTFAENEAHLKDTSIEEVVEGATIGALVGGNFQGASSLANAGQETVANVDRNAVVEKEFTAAVESGDVTTLADAKSPAYDPVRAVNALHQFAQKGDEAAVRSSIAQADQIQQDLAKQVSALEESMHMSSPEGIQESRDILARATADGANQAVLKEQEAEIAQAEAVTPAQRKAGAAELARLNTQLDNVRQAAERLQVDTSPEQAEIAAIAQQAEAGDLQAVDRLLTLTMTNPDSIDTQVADALAVSPRLSVEQRSAMRAFSEAQVAANALKGRSGVRSDIATGGDGFKGIPQYRNAIRMALANGNVEAARSQVDGIASFAASRESKFNAIAAAYEQVKGSNNTINLVRDVDGVWNPTELKGTPLKKAGGLEVDARSFKLRDDVQFEADVLAKTATAYQALVDTVPSPAAAAPLQAQAAAPETTAPATKEVAEPVRSQEDKDRLYGLMQDAHEEFYAGKGGVAKEAARGALPDGFTATNDGRWGFFYYKAPNGKDVAGSYSVDTETGVIRQLDIRSPSNTEGTADVSTLRKILAGLGKEYPNLKEVIARRVTGVRGSNAEYLRFAVRNGKMIVVDRAPARYADGDPVEPASWATPYADEVTAEPTAQVEETPAAKVAQEAGQLTALRNRPTEPVTAENYTNQNLVAALFTQQAGNDTDATVRPLVAVQDFRSKVLAGEVKPQEFLDQDGELSGPQRNALFSFFKFAEKHAEKIRAQFKIKETRAKRTDYFYTDMAQFLVNEDGAIDENLATAVAYGVFSWANENATQLRNTDPGINTILNKPKDSAVGSEAYKALSAIGTREAVVAAQLGARIMQALGMRVNEQGTQAEQAKMEASIGGRAIAAMVSMGLAERVQLSDAKLQTLMGTPDKAKPRLNHSFVRVKSTQVDGRVVAVPAVVEIRKANTASQSVLNKVFSVEAAGIEPSYKPVKFTQVNAKRTQQEVPSVLAEAQTKEGKKAHTIRQDMYQVWGNLSTYARYIIAGVLDPTDVPTHVENLAGRQAKNDGLRQQVDNFEQFVDVMVNDPATNGLEQSLYFGRSVWNVQRVGLTANVINPQTSKVHRHMMAMKDWKAKVDPSNSESMNNFKLRVLEGFGVKTEATNTHIVLAGFAALVNPDVIADKKSKAYENAVAVKAGVDALAEILRGEANDTVANEQAIVAAVKVGGANFHSLDALVAMATMQNANGQPFETQMMGEVDGVTNGPMLSLLMLGAKDFETLMMGGFFPMGALDDAGKQLTQFNDYHAMPGNLDLYESSIAAALRNLQGRSAAMLAALQVITGKLQTPEGDVTSKGRKIIKQPLTALMFGSNTRKAVEGMADGFIESIYTKMEEAAANRSEAELKVLLDAVNVIIGNKRLHLDAQMSIELAMNTKLSDQQKKTIKDVFYQMLGQPTEKALGDTYATFIARRDTINQTAQTAFDLYKAALDSIIDQVTAKSGTIARNSKGEPIRELTKAELVEVNERIAEAMPVLQTAMSLQSNQPSAGLQMAKTKRKLDGSLPYTSNVAFADQVETIDPNGNSIKEGSSQISGMHTEEVDPGVRPFITSIHSTDSAIASAVYGMMQALNVHDALGVDLNNVAKVGQELNKATFNTMLNYSSPTEMSNMLDRVLNAMAKLLEDQELAERIQWRLIDVMQIRADKGRGNFSQQMEAIRATATAADLSKLSFMEQMFAVGQYATEGGSYMVTEADRAAAAKKKEEVGSSYNEGAAAVASKLDEMAHGYPVVFAPTAKVELSNDSIQTLAPATTLNTLARVALTAADQLAQDIATVTDSMVSGNRTLASAKSVLPPERAAEVVEAVNTATVGKTSVWGQLGTPLVHSDVNLVQLLETTEMTAHNLADALIAYTTDPFTQKILAMVKRAVSPSLPIHYVTSKTGPEGAIGEGVDKSRGWYTQRNGTAAIYVKSSEFVESGINTEMLTHELVHAALASIVDKYNGTDTDIGQAVADLEALRVKAAELIGNNGALSAKYRNATSNVHELLAWGLTNAEFQKDVLAKIQVEPNATIRNAAQAEAEAMQTKYEARYKARNDEFLVLDANPNMSAKQRERYVELETFLDGISDIPAVVMADRLPKNIAPMLSEEDRARLLDLRRQYRAPAQGNRILDGLKSFIDSLTKMLFRGNAPLDNTGMALLVANSTGLFREAAKLRAARDTQTLKYEDAINHVNAMTAGQVFDALETLPGAKTDAAHAMYLRDLLESAVEPLYGPYGAFKEEAKADMAITPLDVFLKAVSTGNLPFSTDAATNAFISNQQEAFVLESLVAVVEAAMVNPNTLFVRGALENLYKEARTTLKPFNFHPGDWATASKNEKDIAEAKFAFMFRPAQAAGGKSDYLARFAALGLASKEVKNILTFATADHTKPLKSLPWGAKLFELFQRLMTKLTSLRTKVKPGDVAGDALNTLVGQLVDIEAKRKKKFTDRRESVTDQLETALGNVGNNARERAEAFGKLPFFRQSRSPFIKLVGVGISTLAGDRVEGVLNHITVVRDKAMKSQHGLLMGIVGEMRGAHSGIAVAVELFKQAKRNEQERLDLIESTVAQVMSSFEADGANLTADESSSITKVFLRTNASAIADVIGTDGLKNLLEDKAAMAKFRSDLEQQVIATSTYYDYMISQTKDLAHHKVVGGSTSANLMLNTGNITAMYGTLRATTADLAVAALLDQLVAVYALEYSPDLDMRRAMQVFRTESARGEGQNGIDMILKLHSSLQKKSSELLFKGTEALRSTGYTPEIYDNKVEVLLVSKGKDVESQLRAGFAVGTDLQEDPHVGFGANQVLMTRMGAEPVRVLTGAMSNTGMSAKGSSPITEAKNMLYGPHTTSAQVRQRVAAAKAQPINDLFNRGLSYDPRKAKSGHMAPTLAPDGRIADYRHLMTEHNRDVLLDRDNSMDQVLGVLAGQIADKVNTATQNADVVRSLRDQYQADYTNRPSSYLMVGEDSPDEALAELYRLLPESTKREIRKEWKGNNMFIPADQINLIMGYRKYTFAEPVSALPSERNVFEKTLVMLMKHLFGEKAALRAGQATDVLQFIATEVKDFIVIKSMVVLAWNIVSNMTLNAWEGVPFLKGMAAHSVAIKGALDYRKDSKRLLQLEQALEIGYVPKGTLVIENEIVELRDRIARNPVKPMIDAGLMPTIVEDVETNESRYSYKSRLQRKTEKYTSKVPSWLRTASKQVYMTHDTGLYKFLSQATQLSDFAARYAMYEHVTTRAKDPMSQKDALKQAEESFVNYDLPSHRKLQFMNDIGIVRFSKYYLRIQKVIARLVRERPARGLMLVALNHYFTGMQTVMDSSWVNHLGNNPLSNGPFGYVGALGELPAIKLL